MLLCNFQYGNGVRFIAFKLSKIISQNLVQNKTLSEDRKIIILIFFIGDSFTLLSISFLKSTVQILCIGTDRSQQTVQTKIRLLLKKQSDQGLRCLPFHQHLLDALMQCFFKLFYS